MKVTIYRSLKSGVLVFHYCTKRTMYLTMKGDLHIADAEMYILQNPTKYLPLTTFEVENAEILKEVVRNCKNRI